MPWQVLYTIKAALTLAAFFGWFRRRELFEPGSWFLGIQLALAASVEVSATLVALIMHNNLWLYDIYITVEYLLLAGYAFCSWKHILFRTGMVLTTGLFLLVSIPEQLIAIPDQQFVVRSSLCSGAIMVMAYTALLFKQSLWDDRPLFREPRTWVCLGLVLSFGGMLPILGLLNVMNERDPALASQLYIINDVLFAVRYGAVIIGTWFIGRTLRTATA